MKNNTVVILANGRFPQADRPTQILNQAGTIVCCDAAADALLEYGIIPDVIIGDMDSLSVSTRKKYREKIIQVADQETNDLTKAVFYCVEKGYKEVVILGATGKREDHTLGNISLILEYARQIDVKMVTDYGEFGILKSGEEVASFPGERVSFFSKDHQLKVSSTGLLYSLEELQLQNWWRATLNEVISDSFTLYFDSSIPLLMFRSFSQ
ncbi:thiamine diphosphokinase [Bacteroidota bacterium]